MLALKKMTSFKNSMMLTASICGIITSLPMFLASSFAHLSATSAFARSASNYVSSAAVLLLLVSVAGVFMTRAAGPVLQERPGARVSSYAIASVVLGFPLFGLMTWGLTSLGGMVSGVVALKRICSSDEIRGRELAISGICLSFSTFPLVVIMLLFLGP